MATKFDELLDKVKTVDLDKLTEILNEVKKAVSDGEITEEDQKTLVEEAKKKEKESHSAVSIFKKHRKK